MFSEKVFTVEEIADYFKVPQDAVKDEIAKGNLRAINVGGYQRVLESDLNAYKSVASGSTHAANGPIQSGARINLYKAPDFDHKWPDGKSEKFSDVHEGTATYLGSNYGVKVGFTIRDSSGKPRRRSLVLI